MIYRLVFTTINPKDLAIKSIRFKKVCENPLIFESHNKEKLISTADKKASNSEWIIYADLYDGNEDCYDIVIKKNCLKTYKK